MPIRMMQLEVKCHFAFDDNFKQNCDGDSYSDDDCGDKNNLCYQNFTNL